MSDFSARHYFTLIYSILYSIFFEQEVLHVQVQVIGDVKIDFNCSKTKPGFNLTSTTTIHNLRAVKRFGGCIFSIRPKTNEKNFQDSFN